MSFPFKKQGLLLLSACLILVCSQFTVARDKIKWKPITPAELAMKTSSVEPDADAEAIFWDVKLDDSKNTKMTYYHYVRVKIFTERGREKFSKVDVAFNKKREKIENLAARVINPDGSIVNVQKSDIFEREIVKAGKTKIRAKSFAVPGIKPGVIVEYQYEEIRKGDSAGNERLVFQRDIPMQSVSYRFRPHKRIRIVPRFYNMPEMRFIKDKRDKNFFIATLKNVPALIIEPLMPPKDEVQKWAFLTSGSGSDWSFVNRRWGFGFVRLTKPKKQIKQKTAQVIAGATTDDEKLRRIYKFVQTNIKNTAYDRTITATEREKLKLKGPKDVLKKAIAPPLFIDMLFASMARAADMEVNLVLTGDRSDRFFHPNKYPSAFIGPTGISVNVDGEWKFFNPGTPYLPYGKLVWYEENMPSMLVSDTGYIWKTTTLSGYADNRVKRKGKLKLTTDGTLEGDVEFEYFGHYASSRRRSDYNDANDKRKEDFKTRIKDILSTAEVTNITIENFDDNEKPLVYKFRISVPNYAQKAGSRLFFKPGVFESSSSPVFSAATRVHPIYFRYPWSEVDEITIDMPKGYNLDSGEQPGDVEDPSKIGSLKISIAVDKPKNQLIFDRKFHFGAKGNIYFKKEIYTPLKNLFDHFHKSDSHTLALKKNK